MVVRNRRNFVEYMQGKENSYFNIRSINVSFCLGPDPAQNLEKGLTLHLFQMNGKEILDPA